MPQPKLGQHRQHRGRLRPVLVMRHGALSFSSRRRAIARRRHQRARRGGLPQLRRRKRCLSVAGRGATRCLRGWCGLRGRLWCLLQPLRRSGQRARRWTFLRFHSRGCLGPVALPAAARTCRRRRLHAGSSSSSGSRHLPGGRSQGVRLPPPADVGSTAESAVGVKRTIVVAAVTDAIAKLTGVGMRARAAGVPAVVRHQIRAAPVAARLVAEARSILRQSLLVLALCSHWGCGL